MSNRNNGYSGYTVKASELTKLLAPAFQTPYEELIEHGDREEAHKFLDINLPSHFPRPESVFWLNDEDESDDLEIGEMYATFAESALFVKSPTLELENLKYCGVIPELSNWVIFG